MAVTRSKAKGRRESGAFAPLPMAVLNHPNFVALTGSAVKLLIDMLAQLRFKEGGPINNGDLCKAWSLMSKRGWKSKQTVDNATAELLHYGFIKLTRQGDSGRLGHKRKPSLYAITFFAVNDCEGKLDVGPTTAPSGDWKLEKPTFSRPRRKTGKVLKFSAP